MTIKRFCIVCLLLCFLCEHSNANVSRGDIYSINDFLNNEVYNYTTEYKQLTNSKWNFYEEINVEYPVLLNLKDSMIKKKLNKRFRQILVEQIETDSFRIKLFLNLKQSISTYYTINNKVKDQLGIYQDNDFKFTPDLTDVNFIFLSCFKSVITFVVEFRYKTQYQEYSLNENLHYFQTYYFNLKTGQEFHPADIFKKSSEKELTTLIENEVIKNSRDLDVEMDEDESDFYDNLEDPSDKKEKKLVNFSLTRDGFPYIKAFSMSYYIPKWTPCTQNIYGLDVEVRLTFNQLKPYLNPNGPFGSLISYSLADSTRLRRQNNPQYMTENNKPVFWGYDKHPLFIGGGIKTVTLSRLKKVKKKNGEMEDTAIMTKQAEYLQNGYIKEIRQYEGSRVESSETFNFDQNHNLIKKARFEGRTLEKAEDYTYDKNANLIMKSETVTDYFPERLYYYYTNDCSFQENYGNYGYYGAIENYCTKTRFNDSGLATEYLHVNTSSNSSNDESVRKYDKAGHLLMAFGKTSQPLTGSVYVYDKKGRVMTYEYDNGRYLHEYKYDERNNLIQETVYSGNSNAVIRKGEYDVNNRLIKYETIDKAHQSDGEYRITIISYEFW